jgi:hypothetical protein
MVAHAQSLDAQFQLPAIAPRPFLVPAPPPIPPGEREDVRQLRSSLAPAVAARLTSGAELIRALAKQRREESLPTMIEPLDALLGGGLARGKVTEIAGRGPRWSVVIAALAAATSAGEAAAFIDVGDGFDPQVGEAAGIDLRRMLWVRPSTLKQAVMAAEMLGTTGFQLVVLDTGIGRRRGPRVPDAAWVRLARVSESHGATLLVSATWPLTGTTSEAMIRAGRAKAVWIGSNPPILDSIEATLTLEKHRRIRPGQSAKVTLKTIEALQSADSALSPQHSALP